MVPLTKNGKTVKVIWLAGLVWNLEFKLHDL